MGFNTIEINLVLIVDTMLCCLTKNNFPPTQTAWSIIGFLYLFPDCVLCTRWRKRPTGGGVRKTIKRINCRYSLPSLTVVWWRDFGDYSFGQKSDVDTRQDHCQVLRVFEAIQCCRLKKSNQHPVLFVDF